TAVTFDPREVGVAHDVHAVVRGEDSWQRESPDAGRRDVGERDIIRQRQSERSGIVACTPDWRERTDRARRRVHARWSAGILAQPGPARLGEEESRPARGRRRWDEVVLAHGPWSR